MESIASDYLLICTSFEYGRTKTVVVISLEGHSFKQLAKLGTK